MYPAYQTFKALEDKDKAAKGQLLRYWAVFAIFTGVEFYMDLFVSWVPFYYEIKMAVLLYLSIPFTKGSATMYEMHMRPWLRANQKEIDAAIVQVRHTLLALVLSYRDRLTLWAHESITAFLKDKLPTVLPLYSMVISLATEMIMQLFVESTPAPPAPPAPVVEEAKPVVEITAIVEKEEPQPLSAAETIKVVEEKENLSSNHPDALVSANLPSLASQPTLSVSKTTASSKTATHAMATRQKRSTATKEVAKPKTKNALSGTAMPRPTPSISKPKPVIVDSSKMASSAPFEEDSILTAALSPSKRSNPMICPVSPLRRSAI